MNTVLVIGTGELGHAIATSLNQHASFTNAHKLTVTIRPSTLSSTLSAEKQSQLNHYRQNNIDILPLDVESTDLSTLIAQFIPFTTIIHAGGMTLSPGTQMKVTRAVLDSAATTTPPTPGSGSEPTRKLYIPWQFGLDYDAIGPDAGNGLFAEQHAIRTLLRSQTAVDWLIVSNGIFTSFLFEPVWDVVPRLSRDEDEELTVRALGSWDTRVVATTAGDIARCTAELVLVDTGVRGVPVFITGQSVSYKDVGDVVERVTGRNVRREVLGIDELRRRMEGSQEKLAQYHLVFAEGVGTDWSEAGTYNAKKRMRMEDLEEWLRTHLEARG